MRKRIRLFLFQVRRARHHTAAFRRSCHWTITLFKDEPENGTQDQKQKKQKQWPFLRVDFSKRESCVLYMGMVPRVKCKCPVAAVYIKNHLWLSVIYARALPLKWSLSVLLFRKSDFLLNCCFVIFSPCPLLSSSDFRIAQHLYRHALI